MATLKTTRTLLTTLLESVDEEMQEIMLNLLNKMQEMRQTTVEEDEEVPAPVKPKKSKLKVEQEDEPEEDMPKPKKTTKVAAKPAGKVAAKPTGKIVKKVEADTKPAPKPKKATTADYAEMNMVQLKEIAAEYKLDTKKAKLKNATDYANLLNRIDTLAEKGPDKYIALANKKGVDVTPGRGRPALPTKRAKQVIVALLNAGHTV